MYSTANCAHCSFPTVLWSTSHKKYENSSTNVWATGRLINSVKHGFAGACNTNSTNAVLKLIVQLNALVPVEPWYHRTDWWIQTLELNCFHILLRPHTGADHLQRVRIARNADCCNSQRNSVRLSVHPSVTFRCFVQTSEDTIVRFSATDKQSF